MVPAAEVDATTQKVVAYVRGLLWCVATYATGSCPDLAFSFPRCSVDGISAANIANHAPLLTAEQLESCQGSSVPLGPLACAVAVLPVSEVRNLILPTAPCLAPLLERGGLLAEVARLESCAECRCLESSLAAVSPGSKKGAKRRKALESHRRQHSDIEDVSLPALDAEVQRLCREAPCEEARRLAPLLRSRLEPDSLCESSLRAAAVAGEELERVAEDEGNLEAEERDAEEEEDEAEDEDEEEETDEDEEDGEKAALASTLAIDHEDSMPLKKRARFDHQPLQACPATGHIVPMGQRARLGALADLLSGKT